MMNIYKNQTGNIFTALLGVLAVIGLIAVSAYNNLSGPIQTQVNTNLANEARISAMVNLRVAALGALTAGDCDDDGLLEPPAFETASSAPVGGGAFNTVSGAKMHDPWGNNYGLCVWDLGSSSGDAGCGGSGANRLDGTDDQATGNEGSQTVLAIVSAGPDRSFSTTCDDYSDGTTDVITTTGDDIVTRFSYQEFMDYLDIEIILASCTLPWGGSIESGQDVTAYQADSAVACESETRTCTDGALSGSYTFGSCSTITYSSCTAPWGGTIDHSDSVTAFQDAVSETCVSQTRMCNDGSLSGTYTNENCMRDSADARVFVTSQSFNGNLGGVSGANQKCQDAANAEDLGGSFKAWVSTSTYQPADGFYIPLGAIELINGTEVAASFSNMNPLSAKINLTEKGTTKTTEVWTNTRSDGTDGSQNCSNFTSSSSSDRSYHGDNNVTNSWWSFKTVAYCNETLSLYCFEQVIDTSAPTKTVFVTSNTYTGNLGGIAGGHAKCQAAAANAGLSGTYKAWISDDTYNPAGDFTQNLGPYLLTNGTQIATRYSDLTDGTIAAPINRDEFGNSIGGGYAWSNTNSYGNKATTLDPCTQWTADGSGWAYSGDTTVTDNNWAYPGDYSQCYELNHLYCFEQ